jgi:uncharacterized membrane protein YphA (DoxX/SURF4 family)
MIKAWIKLWIDVVNVNPVGFAYFVALSETALAVALILGLFSNLSYIGGALLAFVIWSTPRVSADPMAPVRQTSARP